MSSIGFRILALLASSLVFFFGSASLLVTVPAVIAASISSRAGAFALVALTSSAFMSQYMQSVPILHINNVALSTPLQLQIVSFVASAYLFPIYGLRASATLFATSLVIGFTLILGANNWFSPWFFSDDLVRSLIVVLPATAMLLVNSCPTKLKAFDNRIYLAAAVIGVSVIALLPTAPIKSMMFDESHGSWETVQATFGPNDFGRGVNYTYSLLAGYSSRLLTSHSVFLKESQALPDFDTALVLKVPSVPFGEKFLDDLEKWVAKGGRLLIFSDHTNLYDSTAILNTLLVTRFGIELNADAVFDRQGLPNRQVVPYANTLLGRIDAFNRPVSWQTGASVKRLPLGAVTLSSFGQSYSDPANYSRPNRFGDLIPTNKLRFLNHSAIVAYPFQKGLVVVVLDSTPWSNFSIFKEEYQRLFRGLISALSNSLAIFLWGWGAVLVSVICIVGVFIYRPIVLAVGVVAAAVSLSASFQVGRVSFEGLESGKDFRVRVLAGSSSSFEFLPQLVPLTHNNYSRIISSLSKHELYASASAPGVHLANLSSSKNWLLLEPTESQLPTGAQVRAHLSKGGNLAVLFGKDQIRDQFVRDWLHSLGLRANRATGLSLSESSTVLGILGRGQPVLGRNIAIVTEAFDHSYLKPLESSQIAQSYTLRPSSLPRTSGQLTVGFAADQFSDASVGEVWEGTQPSALGRLREAQIASLFSAKDFPSPFPIEMRLSPAIDSPTVELRHYLLLEDGAVALKGTLSISSAGLKGMPPSPIENAETYLRELQVRAVQHVRSSCPKTARLTQCENRMLGGDMIEWMLAWISDERGDLAAIELLHERRFSGLGKTVNVVFER